MQIIPAIDLKDKKCVRLSKGIDETSQIFNNDPQEQAIFFQDIGCKKIHIVDLDAAFGRPQINFLTIEKIRKSVSIPIQLGGGIRTVENAKKYFDIGIDNLIIGSLSVTHPEVVKSLSNEHQNKIYISLDIKDNFLMMKGWKERSKFKLEDTISFYNNSDIKGYVITDIKNDGMLQGLDIEFLEIVINKIKFSNNNNKSIIIAGGLTNYNDLLKMKKIKTKNIEGIISGKSFYTGSIDLKEAQSILDSNG